MGIFRGRIDTASIKGIQKKLDALKGPVSQSEAREMGDECLARMKDLIASGISPVRGGGLPTRFERYKNPKKYPGKRKSHTPVNLRLTGAFLDNLSANVIKTRFGYGASIGYDSPKQQVKELGHREGANGQPSRPTIPQVSKGEQFAKLIQDVYLKKILAAIERIIRS